MIAYFEHRSQAGSFLSHFRFLLWQAVQEVGEVGELVFCRLLSWIVSSIFVIKVKLKYIVYANVEQASIVVVIRKF